MVPADCTEQSQVIQLVWEQKDGIVTVTPRDNDRFAIKVGKAIQVLQQVDCRQKFQEQLQLLNKELAGWLEGHDEVKAAFLTLRDGCFAFVVARETAEYDEDFEDELSALDVRLAQDVDLNLIRLNTISLPCASASTLQAFLDPNFALRYPHAQRA